MTELVSEHLLNLCTCSINTSISTNCHFSIIIRIIFNCWLDILMSVLCMVVFMWCAGGVAVASLVKVQREARCFHTLGHEYLICVCKSPVISC